MNEDGMCGHRLPVHVSEIRPLNEEKHVLSVRLIYSRELWNSWRNVWPREPGALTLVSSDCSSLANLQQQRTNNNSSMFNDSSAKSLLLTNYARYDGGGDTIASPFHLSPAVGSSAASVTSSWWVVASCTTDGSTSSNIRGLLIPKPLWPHDLNAPSDRWATQLVVKNSLSGGRSATDVILPILMESKWNTKV